MSTVTPLLNLVKPTTAEQFSLATYNNNLDTIDTKFGAFPKKIWVDNGSISMVTADTTKTLVVNLPAGFTAAPLVYLQYASNAAGRALYLRFDVYNVTTTQFTVKMSTIDSAAIGASFTISFNWLAVQLT